MHYHSDYSPRREREAVKLAKRTTVDISEQEPTAQPIRENDEALERLLLRYLKIYQIAGT